MSGAFSAGPSPILKLLSGRFGFVKRLIRKSAQLKGARVLLIDDVLTTGATAAACARTLKRAGAKHVTLAAVARTDRRIALIDFRDADVRDTDFRELPRTATAASGATAGG